MWGSNKVVNALFVEIHGCKNCVFLTIPKEN